MKRFAVLALAAVFALSFSASVAAAPVFSGEFTVESEANVTEGSGINFDGTSDLTVKLNASEEGLWELSAQLGSVDEVELGKYYLKVTPGPFGLAVWGNDHELSTVTDAFEWITSGKKATDPKFRLTADVLGVDITADYDTAGQDALAVFADAGMIGVAFQDEKVAVDDEGMNVSADVTVDLGIATLTAGGAFDLNAAEGKGSMAFGVKAEAEVAAGLTVNGGYTSDGRTFDEGKPETEISAGATYEFDSITVGADFSLATDTDEINTTTIGGNISYGDHVSGGVEYSTTTATGDETPTLTFEAAVEDYPVIADVFTVSADFLMVNDKEPIGAGKDYRWVENLPSSQRTIIGDHVVTVMEIGVSADYKLIPEFTLTPGFEYRAYTFLDDGTATATILSLDAAYEVSDSAEISFGVEKVKGETADLPVEVIIQDEDYTVLSAGITVNF